MIRMVASFYSGWVSTQALWNTPSNDPIDWTEGRPCFVIFIGGYNEKNLLYYC